MKNGTWEVTRRRRSTSKPFMRSNSIQDHQEAGTLERLLKSAIPVVRRFDRESLRIHVLSEHLGQSASSPTTSMVGRLLMLLIVSA